VNSGTTGRRIVTVVAIVWAAGVFLIVLGALIPSMPLLGLLGTVSESFLSLHIVILGMIGVLLAGAAWQLGSRWGAAMAATLATLAVIGALVPLLSLTRAARTYSTPISWSDHLRITAPGDAARPNATVRFATIGGKDLYADIYLPAKSGGGLSAPVLMMHPGGYVKGERSMGVDWDRWLAERGYTIFDVDYRLAPPVTWKLAAQDAACAASWIAANAGTYHIDPERMLAAGQSAGAGLALQLAYGLGEGMVQSSCGGTVPQPKAVLAIYPPDDFALGWNKDTKLGPITARKLLRAYLGGSPEEFLDRYRAVSATHHVHAGLPPIFIAAGDNDHLVPYEGHVEFAQKRDAAGVPNELVTIPYADHGFDVAWGSIGGQIARHAAGEFLQKYLPRSGQ
jgi:acetyl esterase/lipase